MAATVFALAAWVRLRDVDAGMLLIDSLGPYLTAWVSPWNPHPHAPPYGPGLYPPYALALHAGTLRGAVAVLLTGHALVAPLGALAAWRLGGRVSALAVGLLLATDPGLLDTARSGSEGYLAALWIGVATWSASRRGGTPWGGPALAMAAMNHPLALAAAPLAALHRSRRGLAGLAVGGVMLLPHLLRLGAAEAAAATDLGPPGAAVGAFLEQGGPIAWAVLAGPLLGLLGRRTRHLALATLLSAVLLALAACWLGYLRDHHIRLLTVPALVGWAAVPRVAGWVPLLALRAPASEAVAVGHPQRPGTVGLAHVVSLALPSGPLRLEGAVLHGSPAAEPAALMLDQALRGRSPDDWRTEGPVTWIVSHKRHTPPSALTILHAGDRHVLAQGLDDDALCAEARIGGARDGYAVLVAQQTFADVCLSRP